MTQPHRALSSITVILVRRMLVLAAGALLCTGTAGAQLRFVASDPLLDEYPIVKIPIQIRDNASLLETLNAGNFLITENGVPKATLYLDCDTDTIVDPLTFLFVLDVSYSMRFKYGEDKEDPQLEKWYAAKTAFAAAINAMRSIDAGALYTLSEFMEREVGYTMNKDDLLDGLDRANFLPGTAIYDTIIEVIMDALGYSGRQVMILLTDGSDHLSSWSIDNAIDMAKARGIPVYIIGLDVRQSDEALLNRIATETGGKYHYAPSSEELQNVMSSITESILSKHCLLAYETTDTCRDGRTRNIEITATIPPLTATATTSFSLPDELERVELQVGVDGQKFDDESRYQVPLYVTGALTTAQQLDLSTRVQYDPQIISYAGIVPGGGIGDETAITIDASTPGVLLVNGTGVTLSEAVPSGIQRPLFVIEFDVLYQEEIISSDITLSNTVIGQDCPAIPSERSTGFTVTGCPSEVEVSLDSSVIAFPGNEVRVPVLLHTPIDTKQALEFEFSMYYDTGYLIFEGIENEGTLSSDLTLNIHETSPGNLEITASGGLPVQRTGEMFRLVFRAKEVRDAHEIALGIYHGRLAQTCVPLMKTSGSGIMIDGTCSKIVRRRDFYLGQNAPNPVVRSNGSLATIEYTVSGNGIVSLEVYDLDGKPVATLVNGRQDRGSYSVSYDTGALPTGTYVYILREGDNMWTRKMAVGK